MIFGALVVLLIALTLVFLIVPVLKKPTKSQPGSLDREQQNIRIAQEKKKVIEEQLAQQQMTQDEYDAAIVDLENSLAIDLERQQAIEDNVQSGKWVVWVFALFIPALSIFMYYKLGEYRVIENPQLAQARTQQENPHGSGSGPAPTMSELVDRLKEHLRSNPEDTRGWFMMGRTYMSLRQFNEAASAFRRSHELGGQQDPTVMLALADALAMTRDGNMQGEPEQLVLQALEISPNEVTGLWLAGLSAEQAGRHRQAYEHWMKLLPMLKDDPQSASEVETLLARLKEKEPDLPELDFAAASPSQAMAVTAQGLRVSINLDPALAAQAKPDDLLFIYAKASSGPPMPLAARRMKVSDLPVQISLSDSDAMMPQMSMSKFDQIIVGARVSKTGNPVGQPGDLFDESDVIQHKSFQGVVEINIDQVKQ